MFILLILILAHTISDFILQSKNIVKKRSSDNLKEILLYNFYHSILVSITTFIFLLLFAQLTKSIAIICFLTLISHFIIDLLKSLLNKLGYPILNFTLFFLDQAFHLITIVLLWISFDIKTSYLCNIILQYCKNQKITNISYNYGLNDTKTIIINSMIFIIILVYTTFGGDVIIGNILRIIRTSACDSITQDSKSEAAVTSTPSLIETNNFNSKVQKILISFTKVRSKFNKFVKDPLVSTLENDIVLTTNKRGKFIGIVERFIILILAINNQFTSIAFVIAAKSIARNSKIEKDPDFAEEYLIGTLSSCLLAIIGGYAFNILKIIKY